MKCTRTLSLEWGCGLGGGISYQWHKAAWQLKDERGHKFVGGNEGALEGGNGVWAKLQPMSLQIYTSR